MGGPTASPPLVSTVEYKYWGGGGAYFLVSYSSALHDQAAAALVVLALRLVAIALTLLCVSTVASILWLTVVCLLVEPTDLAHKVVERLVHVDSLLG